MSCKTFASIALITSVCVLSACAPQQSNVSDPPDPAYDALNTGFGLSSEMHPDERQMVRDDVVKLSSYALGDEGEQFQKIFGGSDSQSVLDFVKQRIHYFVSSRDEVGYTLQPVPGSVFSSRDEYAHVLSRVPGEDSGQGVLMAQNLGVVFWMQYLLELPEIVHFDFNGSSVVPNDPRFGLIQLGPGYAADYPQLARVLTLVHEARHSDCTGGLEKSDLSRARKQQAPENHACGHFHVVCPAGHDLAGLPACDDEPWGAYSVEFWYAAGLVKGCTNCTETEFQQALALASDSGSRILDLDDMINGNLGDPDMSSSAQIVGN